MATFDDIPQLKEKLIEKEMPEKDINKVLAYVQGELRSEQKKDADKRPVTSNTLDQLYTMIFKWWNEGLLVDGVNVVITGRGMAMVTFHGYKNKVFQTYPETKFAISLVREGDTFSFSDENGKIVYSHKVGNPFETQEKKIIGAYVVFRNKRGEFLEILNKTDYEKMKNSSKQSYLWGKWESEFVLKSVIKRACKRHFYDAVEAIDKMDNEDYGAGTITAPPKTDEQIDKVADAVMSLEEAKDIPELNRAFKASGLMNDREVVAAYRKAVDRIKGNKDAGSVLPDEKQQSANEGTPDEQ